MINIDDQLLIDVGLGDLPPEERDLMLIHIRETLELRVGTELAEQLSPSQLDDFGELFDAGDKDAARAWLEITVPNYKDVVAAELARLTAEIHAAAPLILEASRETTGPCVNNSAPRARGASEQGWPQ